MTEYAWQMVGWIAQGLFAGRMIVQWWASERCGKSVVPNAFWFMSLAGGMMIMAYSIHKGDAVFIVGSASGLLVYVRNVVLIQKHRATLAFPAAVRTPGAAETAAVVGRTSGQTPQRTARAA